MEQIIAFSAAIAVITGALTEGIKRTKAIPKNFIPIISMVIGVVVGGVTTFIPEIVSELSVAGRLLAGLISGLMATGIWETFKNKNKDNESNSELDYATQFKDNGKDDNKTKIKQQVYDESQPFTDDSDEVEFSIIDDEIEEDNNEILGKVDGDDEAEEKIKEESKGGE